MSVLTSKLLSQIERVRHGFGNAKIAIPTPFVPFWEHHPIRTQVHGKKIVEILDYSQRCGDCDGLFTSKQGLPLSAVSADCVPMLLVNRGGNKIAALHAGWRGTEARIVPALWEMLAAQGEKPSEWVAAIGPAIGPCCYEVSEELAAKFAQGFATILPAAKSVPKPRHLDLPAINEAELRALGIEVEVLRACTRCSVEADKTPIYRSYRREGSGQRQWSAIMLG